METVRVMTQLTSDERETVLNYSNEDKMWYAYTTILKHYNRFKKQGWEIKKQFVYEDGSVCGGEFIASDRSITIRNAEKKKMSDKQLCNLGGADDEDDEE